MTWPSSANRRPGQVVGAGRERGDAELEDRRRTPWGSSPLRATSCSAGVAHVQRRSPASGAEKSSSISERPAATVAAVLGRARGELGVRTCGLRKAPPSPSSDASRARGESDLSTRPAHAAQPMHAAALWASCELAPGPGGREVGVAAVWRCCTGAIARATAGDPARSRKSRDATAGRWRPRGLLLEARPSAPAHVT